MTAKYKLRITGECKQNMRLCKRRGLPMDERLRVGAQTTRMIHFTFEED